MFEKAYINTLLSGLYFVVSGILGLVLVPLLIAEYGVYGFGLIVMARLFLPIGTLGIFDFGIGEIATQSVSIACATRKWSVANGRLILLFGTTLTLSLILAVLLFLLSDLMTDFLNVKPSDINQFHMTLAITAALLPVLFISLLFEGVVKGFENFIFLRSMETLWVFLYSATVIIIVRSDLPWHYVIFAHLASLLAKAICVGLYVVIRLPRAKPTFCSSETTQFIKQRAALFGIAKLLSGVQHNLPPVFIGLLIGPVGVGIYEALLKLPRFLKSALGILVSVIIPTATKLDVNSDYAAIKKLSDFLAGVLPIILIIPMSVVALLSRDILYQWLGSDFSQLGPWLVLYLAVPFLTPLISFQNSILLNRPSYLKRYNVLTAVMIVFQFTVSILLSKLLGEFAFILGQAMAIGLAFYPLVKIADEYLDYDRLLMRRSFLVVVFYIAICSPISIFHKEPIFDTIQGAALCYFLITFGCLVTTLGLLFSKQEKKMLTTALRALAPARFFKTLRN